MKLGIAVSAGLLFASCSEEQVTPKIEQLRFPVVMLFGNASMRICQERADLLNMHTNYLTLNSEPPIAIDSEFKIYTLDHFSSVHGGLWLMAHPSGPTEVTFELKPQKSGRENARELFAQHLEKQTWRHDLETQRAALATKQTLLEMAAVLEREDAAGN